MAKKIYLFAIILLTTSFQDTYQSFVSLKKLFNEYEQLNTKYYQPEQIHISYGGIFEIFSLKFIK